MGFLWPMTLYKSFNLRGLRNALWYERDKYFIRWILRFVPLFLWFNLRVIWIGSEVMIWVLWRIISLYIMRIRTYLVNSVAKGSGFHIRSPEFLSCSPDSCPSWSQKRGLDCICLYGVTGSSTNLVASLRNFKSKTSVCLKLLWTCCQVHLSNSSNF